MTQTKIEDLVQKKDEIRASLDNLEKMWKSKEKEKTQKEIAIKFDELKKEIDAYKTRDDSEKWKLDNLRCDIDKISDELKKFDKELDELEKWILSDKKNTPTASIKWNSWEKWIWDKTKDFVSENWSDVISWEKWHEEPWKNLVRAVGFWLTWIAIYKWVKSLWNWAFWDKKKETKTEEKSFRDKPIWKILKTTGTILWVGTWVYYLAHGIYTQNWWINDLRDRERWKKLEFDTALNYAAWAISNQNDKKWMSYGLNLKYHEDTSEIEAYWERIKIDKNKRKIEWLNEIQFKNYENMICTAILTAYLKKEYTWQCKTNAPFSYSWSWSWNVDVNGSNGNETAANWSWNWGRIVWISAWWIAWIATWIFWWLQAWAAVWTIWWIVGYWAGYAYDNDNILHDYMPELNNANWMKSYAWYLNKMRCWQEWNQKKDEIAESPIKQDVVDCVKEIEDSNRELPSRWRRRKLNAIPDPVDEKKYTIKAYGRDLSAEVDISNRTIKILWITWWSPEIDVDMTKWKMSELKLPLKEGLFMAELIGFFLDNFHHKWNEYPRFEYTWKATKILPSLFGTNNNWIYFSDPNLDTLAYTKETFEKRMPTLFKEENRDRFLEFLNDWIVDDNGVSIRKNND
jgi:hypothetical protein